MAVDEIAVSPSKPIYATFPCSQHTLNNKEFTAPKHHPSRKPIAGSHARADSEQSG
jgi:hypothetical protein